MGKQEILTILGEYKRQSAKEYGIVSLGVFGSVARGEADHASDVDLVVDFDQGRSLCDLGELIDEFEIALGCRVDVVSSGALRGRFGTRVATEAVEL